jgi:hypothetical protein
MRRRLAISPLSGHGAVPATPANDALDNDMTDDVRLAGPSKVVPPPAEPVTTVRVAAPPAPPVQTPSANPLWGIPLAQLSGTRERPIFSASRRPPPVAAIAEAAPVKPPPRKKEIEPPQLSLVGTIASIDEGFGIFIDQSSKAAVRLKVGDDHQGWKLRQIRGREVTMEKDDRSAVLTLPQPGGQSSEVRLLPVNTVRPRY